MLAACLLTSVCVCPAHHLCSACAAVHKPQVAAVCYLSSATRDHLLDPTELPLLHVACPYPLPTGQWNAQAVKTAMELRRFPSLLCPGVTCPRILCADPHYNAKDCCPSCDHSQCLFSGCVTLSDSQAGNLWQPDPCTTCYCVNGKRLCDKKICPPLDCPAELTATKPGVCCPYCSYLKIKKGCKVLSDKTVNITIKYSEDDVFADKESAPDDDENIKSDCVIQVAKHRCATKLVKKYGKVYRCLPRYQKRHVNVNRLCHLNRAKIAYTDVTHCVGHVHGMRKGGSSIPEPQCDLFVPSRDPIKS